MVLQGSPRCPDSQIWVSAIIHMVWADIFGLFVKYGVKCLKRLAKLKICPKQKPSLKKVSCSIIRYLRARPAQGFIIIYTEWFSKKVVTRSRYKKCSLFAFRWSGNPFRICSSIKVTTYKCL